MGFTSDVDEAHNATQNYRKTPKKVKFDIPDEWFTCDLDEIHKRFRFYLSNFNDDIEFAVCEKNEKAPLSLFFFPASQSFWTSILL